MIVHSHYEEDPRVRREAESLVASGRPVVVLGLRLPGQAGRRCRRRGHAPPTRRPAPSGRRPRCLPARVPRILRPVDVDGRAAASPPSFRPRPGPFAAGFPRLRGAAAETRRRPAHPRPPRGDAGVLQAAVSGGQQPAPPRAPSPPGAAVDRDLVADAVGQLGDARSPALSRRLARQGRDRDQQPVPRPLRRRGPPDPAVPRRRLAPPHLHRRPHARPTRSTSPSGPWHAWRRIARTSIRGSSIYGRGDTEEPLRALAEQLGIARPGDASTAASRSTTSRPRSRRPTSDSRRHAAIRSPT